ncbi:MAG: ABC transporter permease [Promethearchaeota archaeon]
MSNNSDELKRNKEELTDEINNNSEESLLNNLSPIAKLILPFIIIGLIVEILAFIGIFNPILFPPPSKIFFAFIKLIFGSYPSLIDHILRSLVRIVVGYVIGVSLGIIIGILMGLNKTFYQAVNPIIAMLISIPTLAWVPLLLIIVGLGDETVIIAIALACIFPQIYSTLNGIRGTNKQLVWAAEIMGAGRLQIFLQVLIPSALVSILTGMRLAVGYSWRAVVGAEMLATIETGIGQMIYAARWGFNVDIMFAGLVVIALGGLLMDRILMIPLEERTIKRWGMVKSK